MRVQRLLDGPHHGHRGGVFVQGQFAHFEFAHAMLGTDGAVEFEYLVKHQGVHALFVVAQKDLAIHAFGGLHVVVQVAIAQVA